MVKTQPQIDVIVPARNEAESMPELVQRIHAALSHENIPYRIFFIDDNSSDNSKSVAKDLAKTYPLYFHTKVGKQGKAFSILEGVQLATAPFIAMIDADLEYPPESLPTMYKKMTEEGHGAVVAHRIKLQSSGLRKFASRINKFVFGKMLLGFDSDVQSGLKMFRREIFAHLDATKIKAWAIDMPLLHLTLELGYTLGRVDINFAFRQKGTSKLRSEIFRATREIVGGAIRLRRTARKTFHIPSTNSDSHVGAGVIHKRKRYITHSILPLHLSALSTLSGWQKPALFITLGALVAAFIVNPQGAAVGLVAVLTCIYFLDVLFNLFLVFKSLHFPPELVFSPDQLSAIDESKLPVYSILCPLYKEAHVLPQFLASIEALDWPKNKLEVLLLLEEDDTTTIEKAKEMDLPSYVRTLVVPHSFPKTKPKACNFGLAHTRGEFAVIYDAEDRPDANQLKIAYLGFKSSAENVACLQAKLNYYNPHQNLLTRLFTAEYSLWFDLTLPGLQSVNTAIPLGGTSNHFKTSVLRELQGWDAFNVTEDCDLGARLFKAGFTTSIIDSTTLEEANSNWGNWLRQRSRWIKGYIQTYLVHNRHPLQFLRQHGIHALIFQLVVGGKIAFMVINPLLWIATILYFTMYAIFGPAIEALYPAVIFYMAVTSLVFGNFLFLYYYMIGAAKRGHWELMKYVFFIPIYWLAVSVAAFKAFTQLVINPHYWEKTNHGLHLKPETLEKTEKILRVGVQTQLSHEMGWTKRLTSPALISGGFLVFATVVGNVFNFLYNAYLGRAANVSIEQFGIISLLGSLLEITQIPSVSLARTVTYRIAYVLGQKQVVIKRFWSFVRQRALIFSVVATVAWLAAIPWLSQWLHTGGLLPLILFAPIWIIATLGAIDRGFLSGNQKFGILAGMTIVEAVSKFLFAFAFVQFGFPEYVYLSIPSSLFLSFGIGWVVARKLKDTGININPKIVLHFPLKFFGASVLTRLSSIAFLSLDVVLAKIFLSPEAAGQYALISLAGKAVYFLGSMFSQFITPLVSHAEGAGKNSRITFYRLLAVTTISSMGAFVALGVFGPYVTPILFGAKVLPVVDVLQTYCFAMVAFTVATNIVNYHQIKRQYIFPLIGFAMAGIQIAAMVIWHADITTFVFIMFALGATYMGITVLVHIFYDQVTTFLFNLIDFKGLFTQRLQSAKNPMNGSARILIFNWRDTKHRWAGGAETYLHELAKQWVKDGHQVTLFCGNDEHNPRQENIDGVEIIRHGGFYTVYVWAFFYYIFKFRGKFDLVIDSENGIPFFTPLYVKEPKFLLIYHVHQEMFRSRLYFPMDQIAMFLESKLMPFVYRNQKIMTISKSSKENILDLKFGDADDISIITPGIDLSKFSPDKKTKFPSFSYVGRIRPQKNVDVAIKAFSEVVKQYPTAKFVIGGWGENMQELKNLIKSLHLEKSVGMLGKITEEQRKRLLAQSWAMIQPSSFEGWGITVIEANASNTLVIGSDVIGLRDSIIHNETGILVPAKDQSALTDAMVKVIRNPILRNKLSKNALGWAQNYSWKHSASGFSLAIRKHLTKKSQTSFLGRFLFTK